MTLTLGADWKGVGGGGGIMVGSEKSKSHRTGKDPHGTCLFPFHHVKHRTILSLFPSHCKNLMMFSKASRSHLLDSRTHEAGKAEVQIPASLSLSCVSHWAHMGTWAPWELSLPASASHKKRTVCPQLVRVCGSGEELSVTESQAEGSKEQTTEFHGAIFPSLIQRLTCTLE